MIPFLIAYYSFCILLYFLLLLLNQFTNSLKIFGCQFLTVKISTDELYRRTTKASLLIALHQLFLIILF